MSSSRKPGGRWRAARRPLAHTVSIAVGDVVISPSPVDFKLSVHPSHLGRLRRSGTLSKDAPCPRYETGVGSAPMSCRDPALEPEAIDSARREQLDRTETPRRFTCRNRTTCGVRPRHVRGAARDACADHLGRPARLHSSSITASATAGVSSDTGASPGAAPTSYGVRCGRARGWCLWIGVRSAPCTPSGILIRHAIAAIVRTVGISMAIGIELTSGIR